MGCVNARPRRRGMTISVRGGLLRRRRRFGVFREYIDAMTRVASDGAKLLPYALVPMSKASEASRNVYHEMLLRVLIL